MKFIFLLIIISLVSIVSLGVAIQSVDAASSFNERVAGVGSVTKNSIIYHNQDEITVKFTFDGNRVGSIPDNWNHDGGAALLDSFNPTNGAVVYQRSIEAIEGEFSFVYSVRLVNQGETTITFPQNQVAIKGSTDDFNAAIPYTFTFDDVAPQIGFTGDLTKYTFLTTADNPSTYTPTPLWCTDDVTAGKRSAVSTTVDNTVINAYTTTYSCADDAGNNATPVVLTVKVVNRITVQLDRTGTQTNSDGDTVLVYSVTFSRAVSDFDGTDIGLGNAVLDFANPISGTVFNFGVVPDDASYVFVITLQESAATSTDARSEYIIKPVPIDKIAPTVVYSGEKYITIPLGSPQPTLPTMTCTDNVGVKSDTATFTGTVDPNTAGPYPIQYLCVDTFGNENTRTLIYKVIPAVLPNTIPVTISHPTHASTASITLQISFGESVQDFTESDVVVIGANIHSFDYDSINGDLQLILSNPVEGTISVDIAAGAAHTDYAKTEQKSISIIYDTIEPTFDEMTPREQHVEFEGTSFALPTLTCTDDISGALTATTRHIDGVSAAPEVNVNTLGTYAIQFVCTDDAGNEGTKNIYYKVGDSSSTASPIYITSITSDGETIDLNFNKAESYTYFTDADSVTVSGYAFYTDLRKVYTGIAPVFFLEYTYGEPGSTTTTGNVQLSSDNTWSFTITGVTEDTEISLAIASNDIVGPIIIIDAVPRAINEDLYEACPDRPTVYSIYSADHDAFGVNVNPGRSFDIVTTHDHVLFAIQDGTIISVDESPYNNNRYLTFTIPNDGFDLTKEIEFRVESELIFTGRGSARGCDGTFWSSTTISSDSLSHISELRDNPNVKEFTITDDDTTPFSLSASDFSDSSSAKIITDARIYYASRTSDTVTPACIDSDQSILLELGTVMFKTFEFDLTDDSAEPLLACTGTDPYDDPLRFYIKSGTPLKAYPAVPAVPTNISIASDNDDPTKAKSGDIVTITFDTEAGSTVSGTINGEVADGNVAGTTGTLKLTLDGDEATGVPLTFKFTQSNSNGSTETQTAVKGSGVRTSVTADFVAPVFATSTDTTDVTVGDTIPTLSTLCTDANTTTVTNDAGSATFDAEGDKTVIYTCTDAAGNTATTTVAYSVTTPDTTNPDEYTFWFADNLDDELGFPSFNNVNNILSIKITDTGDTFDKFSGIPTLTILQNGNNIGWPAPLDTFIIDGTDSRKDIQFYYNYNSACISDPDSNVDFELTFTNSDGVNVIIRNSIDPTFVSGNICLVDDEPVVNAITSITPVAVTLDYNSPVRSISEYLIDVSDDGIIKDIGYSDNNLNRIYFNVESDVPKGTELTVTIRANAITFEHDFFNIGNTEFAFNVIYGSQTETTTLNDRLSKILGIQNIPPLVKFDSNSASVTDTQIIIPFQRDTAQSHEVITTLKILGSPSYTVSRVNDAPALALSYGSSVINSVRDTDNYKIEFVEAVDIESDSNECPCTIELDFDPDRLPSSVISVTDLKIYHFTDDRWHALDTTVSENTLSASVDSFSPFAIGVPTSTLVSDSPSDGIKKKKSGGSDDWHKKPTFGISHLTYKQIVDNGFTFNGYSLTVTDNWHTDFHLTSSLIGETNTVKIKTYSADPLKWINLYLGVPRLGDVSDAESEIYLVVSRNYTNPVDYDLDEINHYQKEGLVNENNTSASISKVKCQASDNDEKCYEFTINFTVMAPLHEEVIAISAMDEKRRQHVTYINEGVEFTGASLLDAHTAKLMQKKTNQGHAEIIELIQQDRRYNVWEDQHGYLWTLNEYGTWTQITAADFERHQDGTGNVMTRQNSNFASLIEQERQKALLVFDSSDLISELDDYFAYDYSNVDSDMSKLEKYAYKLQLESERAQKYSSNSD